MWAKFGCGPTVVSKKGGGYRQADRQTDRQRFLQLYIVDRVLCNGATLGCIGMLMKSSGVDMLLTAAFGGVAGIITGKSLTNALRAYRLITTVLLQDFFQSGAKTYQELSEYLEAVREHPVGRLWVDCH